MARATYRSSQRNVNASQGSSQPQASQSRSQGPSRRAEVEEEPEEDEVIDEEDVEGGEVDVCVFTILIALVLRVCAIFTFEVKVSRGLALEKPCVISKTCQLI